MYFILSTFLFILFSVIVSTFYLDWLMIFKQRMVSTRIFQVLTHHDPEYGLPFTAQYTVVPERKVRWLAWWPQQLWWHWWHYDNKKYQVNLIFWHSHLRVFHVRGHVVVWLGQTDKISKIWQDVEVFFCIGQAKMISFPRICKIF